MGIESGTPRKSETGRRSQTLTECVFSVLLVCVACFSVSIPCRGQENQPVAEPSTLTVSQENSPKMAGQNPQSTASDKPEEQPKKKKKLGGPGSFVVAPLPISSPAVGSGIVPLLGYIFPFNTKDKVSPPSTIGVAGIITNNGSRGF